MQSVHAGAVQTHFFIFSLFLKSKSNKTPFGLHFGGDFLPKLHIWVKKGTPKKCFKKVAQLASNDDLLHWPGAPGEPPLSQRFLRQEATIWARSKNTCSQSWFDFVFELESLTLACDLTRPGQRPGELYFLKYYLQIFAKLEPLIQRLWLNSREMQ